MGRRKFTESRRRVNVYIKENLLEAFTFIHYDPARGRADYGALSNKINELLDLYLKSLKKEDNDGN